MVSKSPNVELNLMGNLTKKAMSMTSICKISYRFNQCTKIYTDGSPSLIDKMEEEHVIHTRKRFFILCIYCSSSTYSLDTELLEIDASLCFCLEIKETSYYILTDSKAALQDIK